MNYSNNDYRQYMQHHGVKGMHWGIRRYQNPDGSLTPEGIRRFRTPERLEQARQKNIKNAKRIALAGALAAGSVATVIIGQKHLDNMAGKRVTKLIGTYKGLNVYSDRNKYSINQLETVRDGYSWLVTGLGISSAMVSLGIYDNMLHGRGYTKKK